MMRYTASFPNQAIDRLAPPSRVKAEPLHGQNNRERLLNWLRRVARTKAICPSNREIADRLNTGISWPVELMKNLERDGEIKVHRFSASRYVVFPDGSHTKIPEKVPLNRKHRRKSGSDVSVHP